ncbi:MAG: outer membrane protein transport protein [Chitinophagales bacterium]|nr:outer membrane protein transport protein [Chitinophagales bacterium]
MKKVLLLLFFAVVAVEFSHAQIEKNEKEKKGFDKSKLFFGGNFGLTFGDYTLINISPQLGYRFNDYLAAGAGVNLQYISIKDRYMNGDPYSKISQGVAGLNIFGRVYPARFLMIQAQPELNYVFGKIKYFNPPSRTNIDASIVPSLLLGGGIVFPAGRGGFIVSIFYDVLQQPNSPYSNRPFYNFSYSFGF